MIRIVETTDRRQARQHGSRANRVAVPAAAVVIRPGRRDLVGGNRGGNRLLGCRLGSRGFRTQPPRAVACARAGPEDRGR
jgi:hypothetical protein